MWAKLSAYVESVAGSVMGDGSQSRWLGGILVSRVARHQTILARDVTFIVRSPHSYREHLFSNPQEERATQSGNSSFFLINKYLVMVALRHIGTYTWGV